MCVSLHSFAGSRALGAVLSLMGSALSALILVTLAVPLSLLLAATSLVMVFITSMSSTSTAEASGRVASSSSVARVAP